MYLDAFAGSGKIALTSQSNRDSNSLFEVKEEYESFIDGSAIRAINIDNKQFDVLVFVDIDSNNVDHLAKLEQDHPNPSTTICFIGTMVGISLTFREMTSSVLPFLMFQGNNAEEAINFYVELIPNSRVETIQRYGDSNPDFAESIMAATVSIGGQSVRVFDSPIKHNFDFTPSFSLFVECESEEEIKTITSALEEGGKVLMPLDSYDFSRQFAWVEDRFGVSWQLNCA